MQNERFKFRAWDTKTKKMIIEGFHILGETTCFDLIGQYCSENLCGKKSVLERLDDIVIMQSTGLKDSKGNLIYEGDICNYENLIMKICFGSYFEASNGRSNSSSLGLGYGFYFTDKNENNVYGFKPILNNYNMIKDCEVIGNLYENPELLTTTEK